MLTGKPSKLEEGHVGFLDSACFVKPTIEGVRERVQAVIVPVRFAPHSDFKSLVRMESVT